MEDKIDVELTNEELKELLADLPNILQELEKEYGSPDNSQKKDKLTNG